MLTRKNFSTRGGRRQGPRFRFGEGHRRSSEEVLGNIVAADMAAWTHFDRSTAWLTFWRDRITSNCNWIELNSKGCDTYPFEFNSIQLQLDVIRSPFSNVNGLIMDGSGTIDGQGSAWWVHQGCEFDEFKVEQCLRPTHGKPRRKWRPCHSRRDICATLYLQWNYEWSKDQDMAGGIWVCQEDLVRANHA